MAGTLYIGPLLGFPPPREVLSVHTPSRRFPANENNAIIYNGEMKWITKERHNERAKTGSLCLSLKKVTIRIEH
jgi:hypothetical protein